MGYDFDAPVERRGTWSTRWERYPGDVIPLWVADTDFPAPPPVLAALRKRLDHGVLGYSVQPAVLRDAVIARMQRLYGWRIEPEWLVFVSGVVPGLHLAARHLMRPDQHALVPMPVYHHLKKSLELAQRPHSDVPLVLSQGRWVWDEDALAAAVHVPIASVSREASRRTVTLISPNKAFGFPGAGCAFAVIEDAALRKAFTADHHATVHDASVFGYEAALAACRDCDDWLAAQLAYLRANRDLVEREIAAMAGLKMAHVEATYLAWIDASGLGVPDPHKYFMDRGVAMSPGSQFGDARFVRLNFGTRKALLEEALKRISSASRPSPRG
jgi:cysteine-S-conjugate beta-lyase